MELIFIISIAVLTFLTRIINLLAVPIFTDEAIYIRWAQIGLADPAQRYISLTDGKQPLFTWLMYPMLKFFSDPLFAGRFVSVLSGVAGVIGIYFFTKEIFGKKEAKFATFIYLFSPFALVYDRLALMDSLLASLGVWILYLEILLIKKTQLDIALLLGMMIGLNLLNKSSAQFYIYLLPFSLILFNYKNKKKFKFILNWLGLSMLSVILSQIIYNSLRLSPAFYLIEQKNYTFIYTLSEFMSSPFSVFKSNLYGLLKMLISYLTIPIALVIILGILTGLIKKDKKIIYLFFCFIFPFFSLATFGKVLFPRFILFMVLPLFVIAAKTLADFSSRLNKNVFVGILFLLLIFIYPLIQTYFLIVSPVQASIPKVDRDQLFDDWPSGYGVKEVISYLKEKAEKGKIVVGTEGTFGLNPAVYEIYLGSNKNVEIHGYWPITEIPADLLSAASIYPTYLIFKERQKIPDDWPIKLINKYRRGKGNTYLLFYQVVPKQK